MSPARPDRPARHKAPVSRPSSSADSAAPPLSERQRRHLRGLAHGLKPVVRVGNAGLTPAVTRETDRALGDHELVKVKSASGLERADRDALFGELARQTASALVHRIGHTAVLYRP